MMDYKYFRNVISKNAISQEYSSGDMSVRSPHTDFGITTPLSYPDEAICGATRLSHTYASGVHLGVWNFGEGKVIVNALHIVENLGNDPAADRLLSNILKATSENLKLPMKSLPQDFDKILKKIGYK